MDNQPNQKRRGRPPGSKNKHPRKSAKKAAPIHEVPNHMNFPRPDDIQDMMQAQVNATNDLSVLCQLALVLRDASASATAKVKEMVDKCLG